MARDLKADQETLQAVLNFAQNRDIARAAALAEQTLASGFEHPLLLNVVATRLEQEGKLEEALQLLARAVAMAPDDVPVRHALALCLLRLDRPAESLGHLDELLCKHSQLSFAHASRGNALIALGSLGSAQRSHLRALELEPGNLAATAALASIATHRGKHDEARQWAERALKLAPGFPDAVMSLAAAELANGVYARAEELLQKLILDSRAGPTDRARAAGLLGDVLDADGRYREAFEAYTSCNEALRHIHRRYASGTSMLAYANTLIAAVSKVDPQLWMPPAAPAAESGNALGHAFWTVTRRSQAPRSKSC
jgi:tetratricopeptide (TPR) repeat protein